MMAAKAVLPSLLAVQLSACGGGSSPSAPTAPPPSNPNVVTISTSGVVIPKELIIQLGDRVLFVNDHSRRHDMASDEHPDHRDCPPINQVGLLHPGQRRETENFVIARICGFHDHDDPDDNNLKGRIVIR
jgi:plastocyanin